MFEHKKKSHFQTIMLLIQSLEGHHIQISVGVNDEKVAM